MTKLKFKNLFKQHTLEFVLAFLIADIILTGILILYLL